MVAMYTNRTEAGERLADELAEIGLADPVVLALPRGGVPVAVPIARRLGAPLDLIMVRKIGAPGHEEFAIGAVVDGSSPDVVWNDEAQITRNIPVADRDRMIAAKLKEIEARRTLYLGQRPQVSVQGRDAILVDDGIATGASARAALIALRRRSPRTITLAIPVAPRDSLDRFQPLVDRIVCPNTPFPFLAVGAHYVDFQQTTDQAVISALADAHGKEENRS